MSEQERRDQQPFVTPEQQDSEIADLAHPEVSKDQGDKAKGGGSYGEGGLDSNISWDGV